MLKMSEKKGSNELSTHYYSNIQIYSAYCISLTCTSSSSFSLLFNPQIAAVTVAMERGATKKKASPLSLQQFISITTPLLDLEKVPTFSLFPSSIHHFS